MTEPRNGLAVEFSNHAMEQMADRGATREEVRQAITAGERVPAKKGRVAFRKNFPYGREWQKQYYEAKQVMPIVVREPGRWFVITVYVFYFGGETK